MEESDLQLENIYISIFPSDMLLKLIEFYPLGEKSYVRLKQINTTMTATYSYEIDYFIRYFRKANPDDYKRLGCVPPCQVYISSL